MNFFSYESKPMQILMKLGDLIILNLLFILCSIPVFTIGAAQAGLYTGLKTLTDPDDDTYCTTAFFKGFKTGFKHITLAWLLLFVAEAILAVVAMLCLMYTKSYSSFPFLSAMVALCLAMLFQSLLPLFHARFNCTAFQLIRNSWFLAFAHPIRSLFTAAVTWAPLIFFISPYSYMAMFLTSMFVTIYFSAAYLFAFTYMKKPFKTLIDHYNETHGTTTEAVADEAQTEE